MAHEGVANFEGDEVFLGLFGTVLDGAEEVAVGAEEFGEHAGIELIAFAVVLVDGTKFAGIGYGDVHACIGEVAADPGAVCADFDGDGGLGIILAEFLECGAIVGNGELLEDDAISACGADVVFLIAEIDADECCEWLICVFCFCVHKDGKVVCWSVLAASSPSHSIW